MIFLTVGTWRTGFDRLVKAVDKLVETGVICEQVIAQIGNSSYEPKHIKAIRFYSPDEFKDIISEARMIISHAGIGTIFETVKQSKPIIAVPRKESLGEVDNGHQLTTAKQLEAEGLIIVAYGVSELGEKIAQAEHFTIAKNGGAENIKARVESFIKEVEQSIKNRKSGLFRQIRKKIWPYKILRRNDKQISSDLEKIFNYYESKDKQFDMIIFIPNAGIYLSELFKQEFGDSFNINFIKVRRAFTTKGEGAIKKYIFKKKWLSNIFRHLEILFRLIKFKLGIAQKMTADLSINFDVKKKNILVIDDSCETGTTLNLIKQTLLGNGANSVTNAVITSDLVPEAVDVDYSVYKYMLLRTKNSRDYYAS